MPLIDHRDIARQHRTKLLQSVACAVGAGKTVAVRAATAAPGSVAATLSSTCPTPPSGCAASHPTSWPRSGTRPAFHNATLAPQAADALAAEHAERGRNPVLVVDEAHLLDNHALEAIRLLDQPRHGHRIPVRRHTGRPTHPAPTDGLGVLAALDQRIARALHHDRHEQPPKPPTTSATTAKSPGDPTPCSPTTRSR